MLAKGKNDEGRSYIRYLSLLHTSVHDISTDGETDDDEAEGDPVADFGLLHSWIVDPWLLTPTVPVSSM